MVPWRGTTLDFLHIFGYRSGLKIDAALDSHVQAGVYCYCSYSVVFHHVLVLSCNRKVSNFKTCQYH